MNSYLPEKKGCVCCRGGEKDLMSSFSLEKQSVDVGSLKKFKFFGKRKLIIDRLLDGSLSQDSFMVIDCPFQGCLKV